MSREYMNRFSHLRKRNVPLTAEKFAESINDVPTTNKQKRKKAQREKLLLTIPGRMNRSTDCEKSYQIYLRKDIQEDLDKYCIGNIQSLINYLVRRGLNDLISKDEQVIEEI